MENEIDTLSIIGFHEALTTYVQDHQLAGYNFCRVSSEHRDRYTLFDGLKEYDGEVIGNLRFSADDRRDLPAVGDWVAFMEHDEGKALIHAVLPRTSILERALVGKTGQSQIIATNIDYALIVQAADRDFNINRLERYLTICHTSKVTPIILLNKVDLIESMEKEELLDQLKGRISDVQIIPMSNETEEGLKDIQEILKKGKTYCLLGSSGVGKSTLVNHLIGQEKMKTSHISDSVHKGRHTTTHREMIILPEGAILIDNPGMREIGIANADQGLDLTFDQITELSDKCRFKNCHHINEPGCAVLDAISEGALSEAAYQNYQKMERERSHFEASVMEKRRKDKEMGKLIKSVKKIRNKRKY